NAFREHGCIEVVAGSHRTGLLHHCQGAGFGLYIQDQHIDQDRVFTAEMKRGDVLFMHRRTCHSSLPNISTEVRISFDLRYNPSGQPTGRPLFPGFGARSRKDPWRELRDP
ncbi:MAG: phytanoyl-CoA dioxygenase family protein, partial [Candidatus Latescibacteria bacterium]|nr:phytanoyl-CoA dioxygenase family protein [Candidatus Latescibacterota bacterium]